MAKHHRHREGTSEEPAGEPPWEKGAQKESSPEDKQREFSAAVRLAVDKAAKVTTLAGKSQLAAELIRGIQALTYDLRLISPLPDTSGIPTEGKTLIIVADVNRVLHIRIFDPQGKQVVDTDEATLIAQAPNPDDMKRQLDDLRSELKSLWPPYEPTQSDKARIVAAVASIVNYIPAQKVSKDGALEIYKELEPQLWRFYPGLSTSDYWLVTAWVYAYRGLPPEFKGAQVLVRSVRGGMVQMA